MSIYTREDYDALLASFKAGALKVRHGEKEVTYRSLSEMRRLLDAMAKDLAAAGSPPRDPIGKPFRPGLGSS